MTKKFSDINSYCLMWPSFTVSVTEQLSEIVRRNSVDEIRTTVVENVWMNHVVHIWDELVHRND